jgi:hypothetical protein
MGEGDMLRTKIGRCPPACQGVNNYKIRFTNGRIKRKSNVKAMILSKRYDPESNMTFQLFSFKWCTLFFLIINKHLPVYSGKQTLSADFLIFSSNKSFLFKNRIMDVSVNHLLLQMESNNFILSIIRFCKYIIPYILISCLFIIESGHFLWHAISMNLQIFVY